jgi:ubiquinone/menaquinone biosynthesis C-methylase UbiE
MSRIEQRVELQRRQAGALAERVDEMLLLRGTERALDVGAGTGALAFALAPRVQSVVAVEIDEEAAARARVDAPPNCEVLVGNAEELPFESFSFDVSATMRTLHHTPKPEQVLSELVRVTALGGTILVVDQLAPTDPLAALELNQFERARDPSTTRILADADLRGLFDANGLRLVRDRFDREPRELEAYLDLAGCSGAARDEARSLVPRGYEAIVGWYVLER